MATTSDEMKIVLQVGTELRITNKGEVIVSNPELELAREEGTRRPRKARERASRCAGRAPIDR